MVWVLVCLLGLGLEICLIIVLGRRVTRRYETPVLGEPGTGVRSADGAVGAPGRLSMVPVTGRRHVDLPRDVRPDVGPAVRAP